MGIFDIFTSKNSDQAAKDQIASLERGNTAGQNYLTQGYSDIGTDYAAGLSPLLAGYSGATAGTDQLKKLLGIGPAGPNDIQTTLENLPGYKFTRDQSTDNILRQNAAQGYGAGPGGLSGNTEKAIADYTTGLANQNYGSYVNQLLPFLTAGTTIGGQIAQTEAQKAQQENANRTTAANMVYGTDVGEGNAQASADLAKNNASANALNFAMNLFKGGANGAPSIGNNVANAASSLFSAFL